MPSTRTLPILVSALAWVSLDPSSARADVIITNGRLNSYSTQSGGLSATQQTILWPGEDSLHLTTSSSIGGNSSSTAYDFAISGSSGHIQSNFTDTRAGSVYAPLPLESSSAFNDGWIFFEVTTAPAFFTATGEFDLLGGGLTDFRSSLSGASGYIFNYQGTSDGVFNQSFTLGDAGGNVNAISTGAYSGVLDVGSYTFHYDPTIRASTTDGGASASGFMRLDFGDAPVPAVPEPSSFIGVALGIAGLFGFRRHRK